MTEPLNVQQLINQFVRAAIWRLTWRMPTWALAAIVGAAFLYALAHGGR